MKTVDAMKIIADLQAALLGAGYQCGNYGPCGDGIDGRYGPATQEAFGAFKVDQGIEPAQVTEALQLLGLPYDGSTLQMAANAWNQWRSTQQVGSRIYELAADAMLAESTGITAETCAEQMVVSLEDVEQGLPPQELAHYEQEKGWPWWLWLILGLAAAGAIGGGIWYYTQWKKKKRRKSSGHKGYKGYGQPGPEITEEEFGTGKADDDGDDDEVE